MQSIDITQLSGKYAVRRLMPEDVDAVCALVAEALAYLQTLGCTRCMLGIDKDNPQSNHFWRKNGFQITREAQQERGVILVAEKCLTDADETN